MVLLEWSTVPNTISLWINKGFWLWFWFNIWHEATHTTSRTLMYFLLLFFQCLTTVGQCAINLWLIAQACSLAAAGAPGRQNLSCKMSATHMNGKTSHSQWESCRATVARTVQGWIQGSFHVWVKSNLHLFLDFGFGLNSSCFPARSASRCLQRLWFIELMFFCFVLFFKYFLIVLLFTKWTED